MKRESFDEDFHNLGLDQDLEQQQDPEESDSDQVKIKYEENLAQLDPKVDPKVWLFIYYLGMNLTFDIPIFHVSTHWYLS